MADLLLFPHELEPGGLPDRCVVCGADSCTPVKRKFRVSVGETSYGVVNVQQLRVREGWVPLCQHHQNHFLSPWFAGLSGCGIFAAAFFLMGCVGFWTTVRTFFSLLVLAAGLTAAIIVARRIKYGAVQEKDVTDDGVHLINLSDELVAAVKAARGQAGRGR